MMMEDNIVCYFGATQGYKSCYKCPFHEEDREVDLLHRKPKCKAYARIEELKDSVAESLEEH